MAPGARRLRAALALLLALCALGPAAPASTWAPRAASEAAGRARAGGGSSPRPLLGATDAPAGATNVTEPAGAQLETPGTALQPPAASPEPAPCPGCPGEAGSGEPSPPPAAGAVEGLPAGGPGTDPVAAPTPGPPRGWEPLEPWTAASSPAPEAGGSAWARPDTAAPRAPGTAGPSPAGRTVAEILDVDYYELFEGAEGAVGRAAATPWALHELYDDLTPFDEADFYPTTSFYADGDEETDEDDLDEEEDEEEEEDDANEAGGLEDENGTQAPTPAAPGSAAAPREPRPTGRRDMAPLPPAPERAVPAPAAGPDNGSSECRSGYTRHNGSCRSLCDLAPAYCHNGGQCYVVEGHGALCRCNTQAYTWHKGPRCEAVITDFQVLCVAVGSAALVLLLLFMLTVCFAKRLYLLKTENSKLRKSKYRSPSELHNDNFSLSTIAEGSHPNDDGGPKVPELLPPGARKDEEEEAFVPGAPSPKRPPAKAEPDGTGTNCVTNNLP